MKQNQFFEMLSESLKEYSILSLRNKEKIHFPNISLKDYLQNIKEAAVLVPLFFKNDSPHILLTKRAQKVEHHKGEISFPGGAKELEDISLEKTALRETQEEIGIDTSHIKILGTLDKVFTLVSGFSITPYVAMIPYPYPFQSNYQEIEEILEIPFSFFFFEEKHWESNFVYNEQKIPSHFFQWREDIIIWGATGYIIKNLCNVIKNQIPLIKFF